MNPRWLDAIGALPDKRVHPPADGTLFRRLEMEGAIHLPDDHRELLEWSNGIEAYAGYLRLFGVYADDSIDAVTWNAHEFWKFAWGDRCASYWCFAETGWGDQYAYAYESLQGHGSPAVYFLDAVSMAPEVIAPSFAVFIEREFIRSASEPYDILIKQARGRLGPLATGSHLVYVPSLLLGGRDQDLDSVQPMNARSAMIANGDLCLQIDAAPDGAVVKALEPYEDQFRRTRLRVVWA